MAEQPLSLTMLSPLPVYLDEMSEGTPLAPRPNTLDGRIVGLLPNWRPSAVKLLQAVGQLLSEKYHIQALVKEQPGPDAAPALVRRPHRCAGRDSRPSGHTSRCGRHGYRRLRFMLDVV